MSQSSNSSSSFSGHTSRNNFSVIVGIGLFRLHGRPIAAFAAVVLRIAPCCGPLQSWSTVRLVIEGFLSVIGCFNRLPLYCTRVFSEMTPLHAVHLLSTWVRGMYIDSTYHPINQWVYPQRYVGGIPSNLQAIALGLKGIESANPYIHQGTCP